MNLIILCQQTEYWGNNSSWFWSFMQFLVYTATLIAIIIQVNKINVQISLQNKQLSDQVNSNIVSFLNSLNEQWWSTRMRKARRQTCLKFKGNTINVEEEAVMAFFENLGLYCDKKMIDSEFVWETYSYYIERYYKVLENNISAIQEKDPTYFDGFVKLHKLMNEISKQKGITQLELSAEDIQVFVDSEKLCYTPKTS